MRDFDVGGRHRSRSVGFDGTQRSGVVVTVGISITRDQEALLLENLYQTLHTHGYDPFRTKSRDLDLPPEKVIDVLNGCGGEVGVYYHTDGVNLGYAEPTHSAMLLQELEAPPQDTVAIVDGADGHAKKLYRAADGMGLSPPAVAHCPRSELYYPHLLLADLAAGVIADKLVDDDTAFHGAIPDNPVQVLEDTTPSSYQGDWNKGYESVARKSGRHPEPPFVQRRANSVRERVACWFHGHFGTTAGPAPDSDSVTPVVSRLQHLECREVAEWLSSV